MKVKVLKQGSAAHTKIKRVYSYRRFARICLSLLVLETYLVAYYFESAPFVELFNKIKGAL